MSLVITWNGTEVIYIPLSLPVAEINPSLPEFLVVVMLITAIEARVAQQTCMCLHHVHASAPGTQKGTVDPHNRSSG